MMIFNRVAFTELGSTNDEALRRVREGIAGQGLVITARRQTSGRGRQGRQWSSSEGNLFASFVLCPRTPVHFYGQISLVAAVAVGETIGDYGVPYSLKWPNDVMVGTAKIAGLLLECEGESVVLGIGINVASSPVVAGREVTCLTSAMADGLSLQGGEHHMVINTPFPDVEGVLARLQEKLAYWYDFWENEGISPVRDAWLSHAMGIGSRVQVALAGGKLVEGFIETMDERGALVVQTDEGQSVTVFSGEVFFTSLCS